MLSGKNSGELEGYSAVLREYIPKKKKKRKFNLIQVSFSNTFQELASG